MVILGGMANVYGCILGACILTWVNYTGMTEIGNSINNTFGTVVQMPKYQFLVFGTVLVMMMLFRRDGILPRGPLQHSRELDEQIEMRGTGADESRGGEGMTELLLDAQQVRVEFGGLVAVNDVDFTIPVGSIVALIGPNGAGKTTFFNVLTGLYKPTAGTVMFDGSRSPVAPHTRSRGWAWPARSRTSACSAP